MKNRKKTLIIILIVVTIAAGVYFFLRTFKGSIPSIPILGITKQSIDLTTLPRGIFPILKGAKSREVAIYQTHLNDKASAGLVIDGIWGPMTDKASKSIYSRDVVDIATYDLTLKSKEPELIRLAKETQNTIIAA